MASQPAESWLPKIDSYSISYVHGLKIGGTKLSSLGKECQLLAQASVGKGQDDCQVTLHPGYDGLLWSAVQEEIVKKENMKEEG